MLDLVEVARGDFQHLSQRGLGKPALVAQLADPRADERLGHLTEVTGLAKLWFAELAAGLARRDWCSMALVGIIRPGPRALIWGNREEETGSAP
ncbi:hypothetical protein MINTM008_48740 [Mycobacterium intracellulare]|uniref:Uncharacterized protein n=1 Tax=Mycobacterium intracellulare TaxID=1767 RepID=A0A7R7MXL6_MYCIT|nr:hypothetical protein MINTM002_46060 [Mycobacterium intracellulare]BCO64711.1 hypothetical protein MINTM006_46610 [Mycobacterium intracellulare]BCO70023.1 hypothetical protein MINTM007_46340 [Mycobacterium intracellulare]BCO75539.1 hypothetical protein MINTM008_48740 [Mycobacterium intracellulare]BCO80998.1 hypothetical protein MINTM009_47800 [Mycobacterium intracellulare]